MFGDRAKLRHRSRAQLDESLTGDAVWDLSRDECFDERLRRSDDVQPTETPCRGGTHRAIAVAERRQQRRRCLFTAHVTQPIRGGGSPPHVSRTELALRLREGVAAPEVLRDSCAGSARELTRVPSEDVGED